MRFWRSPIGAILIVILVGTSVLLGAAIVRVDQVTRPKRQQTAPIDFESMMMRVEEVRFPSIDGVDLAGWLMPGRGGRSPIVLAHDLGSSKSGLTHLAVALGKSGYPVLAFDFRGHGDSGGDRSTLGLDEKRDVLGAIDYLADLEPYAGRRIGVYGVGMGAHAAVLAAGDRAALKVLVLDALYPDVGYPLAREVYGGWEFAERRLAFVPRGIFGLMYQTRIGKERAEDHVMRLIGRDLLLVAPAEDAVLSSHMKRMYDGIPHQVDVDGNLVLLPATQSQGLFGDDLVRYHERVVGFFDSRL